MRRGLWLLLVLALFPIATAEAGPKRALVIGNDAYPGRFRLRTCVNDANAVVEFLMAMGYARDEIVLLHDADKEQIVTEIQRLVDAVTALRHDQVVFYYSGHGIQVEDEPGGDEADGIDEALVAVGTFTSDTVDTILVRDDYFHGELRNVAAHADNFVVVLDCCFSGGLFKGLGDNPPKTIPRAELYQLRADRGLSTKGLLRTDPVLSPLGAKALPAGANLGSPLDPPWPPGSGNLVLMTAANEVQRAQAGDPPREPLSKYTAFWLQWLEDEGKAVRSRPEAQRHSLKEFNDRMVADLVDVQTPTLLVKGAEISVDAPVLGRVFPLPPANPLADLKPAGSESAPASTSAQRDHVEKVLEQLLTLPVDPAANAWRVTARASCPNGTVRIGGRYHLEVTPEHDGFLVVLAVQASGKVTFLFPNKYAPKNQVKALAPGQHYAVPKENMFQAAAPAGVERFYVYLLPTNPFAGYDFSTEEGAQPVGRFDALVARHPELRAQFDAPTLAQSLARGMRVEPIRGACKAEPVRGGWARAVVQVTTVP